MGKNQEIIRYMLEESKGMEKEYNKIDNWLYYEMGLTGALLPLLLTTYEKHRKEILKLKKAK